MIITCLDLCLFYIKRLYQILKRRFVVASFPSISSMRVSWNWGPPKKKLRKSRIIVVTCDVCHLYITRLFQIETIKKTSTAFSWIFFMVLRNWGTLETREVVLDRGRWFNSRTFHKLKEFWPKSSAKACSSQPFLVNFKKIFVIKVLENWRILREKKWSLDPWPLIYVFLHYTHLPKRLRNRKINCKIF